MKRLTDPSFVYIPAAQTDLRKTFARLRREQKQRDAKQTNVTPLPKPTIRAKGAK